MDDVTSLSEEHLLCSVGDLACGTMKAVDLPGLPKLAAFNVDGEVFVTSNLCTHQVALLTDGYFEGDCVECPMHGGSFNVRTGTPTSFPCTVALRTFPVRVVDGSVYIAISDAGSATS